VRFGYLPLLPEPVRSEFLLMLRLVFGRADDNVTANDITGGSHPGCKADDVFLIGKLTEMAGIPVALSY